MFCIYVAMQSMKYEQILLSIFQGTLQF